MTRTRTVGAGSAGNIATLADVGRNNREIPYWARGIAGFISRQVECLIGGNCLATKALGHQSAKASLAQVVAQDTNTSIPIVGGRADCVTYIVEQVEG